MSGEKTFVISQVNGHFQIEYVFLPSPSLHASLPQNNTPFSTPQHAYF